MRVSREWSIFDTIAGVVIVGIIVAIVWPQYTDTGPDEIQPAVESRLHTIRSQIELYNVQNPEAPIDATTPVGPAFWEPLVKGGYLQRPVKNPLQGNSTVVGATPAMGTGWVWAPWADMVWVDDLSPVYVFRAVDENGNLYDGDQDGLPD